MALRMRREAQTRTRERDVRRAITARRNLLSAPLRRVAKAARLRPRP